MAIEFAMTKLVGLAYAAKNILVSSRQRLSRVLKRLCEIKHVSTASSLRWSNKSVRQTALVSKGATHYK